MLLLDTHALLWLVSEPERVPARAREACADAGTRRWVSVASVWELSIKVGLGKLSLPLALPEFIASRMDRTVAALMPISLAHTLAVADMPRHHGDPFDRMLVAQARAEGLTLVSGDPAMRAYDVPVLWD